MRFWIFMLTPPAQGLFYPVYFSGCRGFGWDFYRRLRLWSFIWPWDTKQDGIQSGDFFSSVRPAAWPFWAVQHKLMWKQNGKGRKQRKGGCGLCEDVLQIPSQMVDYFSNGQFYEFFFYGAFSHSMFIQQSLTAQGRSLSERVFSSL